MKHKLLLILFLLINFFSFGQQVDSTYNTDSVYYYNDMNKPSEVEADVFNGTILFTKRNDSSIATISGNRVTKTLFAHEILGIKQIADGTHVVFFKVTDIVSNDEMLLSLRFLKTVLIEVGISYQESLIVFTVKHPCTGCTNVTKK